MLKVKGISVERNGRVILSNIDLSIEKGMINSLLGLNGAGKSTLAYTLMGLEEYAPSSGSLFFEGKDITTLNLSERAKLGLTLAWQEPARFEGLTVKDFLSIGTRGEKTSADERIREALELVALDYKSYLQRSVDKTLSGGERKRVELASIFTMQPKLAILDEPDTGIDMLSLNEIIKFIKRLKDRGSTVLVITHREEIAISCDSASLICNGEIIQNGNPADITRYFKKRCKPCLYQTPYKGKIE